MSQETMSPRIRLPRRQAVTSMTHFSERMKRSSHDPDSITLIEAIQKQAEDEDEYCASPKEKSKQLRRMVTAPHILRGPPENYVEQKIGKAKQMFKRKKGKKRSSPKKKDASDASDLGLGVSRSYSAPMRKGQSIDKRLPFETSDRAPSNSGRKVRNWVRSANFIGRQREGTSKSNTLKVPTIEENDEFYEGPEERYMIHSPVNGDNQKMSLRGRVSLDEGEGEKCDDCLMHLAGIRHRKLTLDDFKQDIPVEEEKRSPHYKSFGQQWRTVVFIRHGQSEWNLAKKKAGTAKASAVVRGVFEFMADKKDAVIADSPLSKEGIQQAKTLHAFIEENRRKSVIIPRDDFLRSELLLHNMAYMKSAIEHSVKLLRKELHRESSDDLEDVSPHVPEVLHNLEECQSKLQDVKFSESMTTLTNVNEITIPLGSPLNNPHNLQKYDVIDLMASANNYSVLCASNLRRAVATIVIALWTRLKTDKDEKVQILSCLQEIGRNMDTKSLAPVNTAPTMSKLERGTSILRRERDDMENIYKHQLDTSMNFGDKSTANEKNRLTEFAEFCFRNRKPVVVTCGHSGWFRFFFKRFLPSHSTHITKKRKLDNCSVLAFSLSWLPELGKSNPNAYYICPNSVKLLFGGYKPEV